MIASLLAAVLAAILAVIAWVYWLNPRNAAGVQTRALQEGTSLPVKTGQGVATPNANNPQVNVSPPNAQAPVRHADNVTRTKGKPAAVVVSGLPVSVQGGLIPNVTSRDLQGTRIQPPPPPSVAPKRIRVGGQVESARLIFQPKPEYPQLAKMARIQGTVRIEGVIGTDGTIQSLKVISGHPLLIKAATDAVRQWRYQPTLFNGEPVEVVTEIDLNFALAE